MVAYTIISIFLSIPKNVRRQAKMLYVFNQKDRNELKLIHDENDCVPDDSFQSIKNELKKINIVVWFKK